MVFNPNAAKILTENISNSHPVFADRGVRKGNHVEKAYRFEFSGGAEVRHISIASKGTENGITAYVNKYSASGIEFPSSMEDVLVTKYYPKGHEGVNGEKGLSAAAASLKSLNPKLNEVLRLSIPSEIAYKALLRWYLDENKIHSISNVDQDQEQETKLSNDEQFENLEKDEKSPTDIVEESINFIGGLSDLIDGEYKNKPGEDIDAIVKRRIGQSNFRNLLGAQSGMVCNVSGLSKVSLLIASHIVPWSRSTGAEKTDPDNGLLLAINWDAVFDKGLICFDDQGKVIFSDDLNDDSIGLLGLTKGAHLRAASMTSKRKAYLARHRNEIFEAWKK